MSSRRRSAAEIDREIHGPSRFEAFEGVLWYPAAPTGDGGASPDSVRENLGHLRTLLLRLPRKDFVRYKDRFNALAKEYSRLVGERSGEECVTA